MIYISFDIGIKNLALCILENKIRFINEVIQKVIKVSECSKNDL